MQELIKAQEEQFQGIVDTFQGTGDELAKPSKTHTRAGFTKNKGREQSKARRKMAAISRRRNRAA